MVVLSASERRVPALQSFGRVSALQRVGEPRATVTRRDPYLHRSVAAAQT